MTNQLLPVCCATRDESVTQVSLKFALVSAIILQSLYFLFLYIITKFLLTNFHNLSTNVFIINLSILKQKFDNTIKKIHIKLILASFRMMKIYIPSQTIYTPKAYLIHLQLPIVQMCGNENLCLCSIILLCLASHLLHLFATKL